MKNFTARKISRIIPGNLIGALALLLASALQFLLVTPAFAAVPFTSGALVHARLVTSLANNTTGNFLLVVVKTSSTVGSETQVAVTLDNTGSNGYAVDSTAANVKTATVGNSSCPTTYSIDGAAPSSITSWPGITNGGNASSVSGQTANFTSTGLTASTVYGFCITGGVTSPTVTGQRVNTIATNGANAESTRVATDFITNDQVSVSATVDPSFTFSLSGNTDNFASSLSTTAVTATSGIVATFVTNAGSGWALQVKSSNQALKSPTASNHTITSASSGSITTLSNGTEGYVLAVTSKVDDSTSGSGTVALASKFDDTAAAGNKGGDLNTTAYQAIAYANGATTTDSITFKERSTISGLTPAATDYNDVLTVVGSGNF